MIFWMPGSKHTRSRAVQRGSLIQMMKRLADNLGIITNWHSGGFRLEFSGASSDHLERVQHLLTSVAEDCMLGVLQLASKEMSELESRLLS